MHEMEGHPVSHPVVRLAGRPEPLFRHLLREGLSAWAGLPSAEAVVMWVNVQGPPDGRGSLQLSLYKGLYHDVAPRLCSELGQPELIFCPNAGGLFAHL